MSTGDRSAVSAPNWPKMPSFLSPRASGPRKPAEFRGFFPETGDCALRGTGGLGREDSNLRMAESKSAALPLGDAPMLIRRLPPSPARGP
jgi:hypothetical protein